MLYFWKPSGQIEIIRTETQFQKSNLISVLYLQTPVFSPETSYMSSQFGRLNDFGQFEPEGDPVMMIGTPLGNLFEWVCTVPTSMLEIDGTISFSFTASVLSGQVEGENTYTSVTSGVISRYVNPSAGVPAPPLDLLTKMQEDIDYLFDNIGGTVRSVNGVFPDENRNVPLIVYEPPDNPQEGQILIEILNEPNEQSALQGAIIMPQTETTFAEETYADTPQVIQNEGAENVFANETYGETYTETYGETVFGNSSNENYYEE